MKYQNELELIRNEIKNAFELFSKNRPEAVEQKTAFDLVTEVDKQIELYLTAKIKETFPDDIIHGEEWASDAAIGKRTWTIDPIDGTCNMAAGIRMYGVQCSLIEGGRIVLGIIYLPWFNEMICAVKGEGCWLNNQKVTVKADTEINNALVSFGDYPHKNSSRIADWQHHAIGSVYGLIAKIRMFGAACMDFSFVATGKTSGTVVITTNLWDIAPGIIICEEAGAVITDLDGNDFSFGTDGVIAAVNEKISELLVGAFRRDKHICRSIDKDYDAAIFDFDGVIMDTEKYHFKAWYRVFADQGIKLSENEYSYLKSSGRHNIIAKTFAANGKSLSKEVLELISAQKECYFKEYIKGLSEADVISGVRDFLEHLKRRYLKIAVCSSSRNVMELLAEYDLLHFFDVIIDGNTKLNKKPSPEPFLKAAEKLGCRPENCLVFEDSLVGVESACSGGFDVITVGLLDDKRSLCRIADFEELI